MEMKIDKKLIDEAVQKAVQEVIEEVKQNNIWIPEGMTNKEIISEFVVQDDSFSIMVDEVNGTVNIELSLDFWNAPYQKRGE